MQRRGRTSRPTSRAEAREQTRQRRVDRLNRPPSWRSALNRAALAAAVFFGVLVLLLRQEFAASIALALFMFLVYVPLGYAMDTFLYRLRQRRKERERSD